MERSPLVVVVATLVLAVTLCPEAWANCNAIPDAESARIGGFAVLVEQDPMAEVPASEAGLIGFKGALGRIDRIQLIPRHTAGFRIQPDGQCVQAVGDRLIVREVPAGQSSRVASDLVVSLLTQPARGGSVQALVLGNQQVCDALGAGIEQRTRAPGVALRCVARPPESEAGIGGRLNVRVRLPADGKLFGGDGTPLGGPATVVLTSGVRSRGEYEAMLLKIAADGCAAHCAALGETEPLLACVDQFYGVLPDGVAVLDPVPCEVTIPANFTKNDFKEKCEDLDPPAEDLATCANDNTVLKLWEDRCGGIHIPFDWTEIRKDTSTTPHSDITRMVAGRSATSRTEAGKLSSLPIWIPGREFLGSTPWSDPQGTAATTDWRKPEVDVWYPADSPQEIGLRGSVDGPDSIVHIFPRMPVSLVCRVGSSVEACMGVEGEGGISCACLDRYPAGCVCERPARPQFFACDGGEFDGMPCTRHRHCNSSPASGKLNGNCSKRPSCQRDGKNGVWQSVSPPSATGCWDDDACKSVPNRPWCGYRLFDFEDRQQSRLEADLRELDAIVDPAPGNRARRGACRNARTELCNNDAANACDPAKNEGDCRGYTLRAEGKKP